MGTNQWQVHLVGQGSPGHAVNDSRARVPEVGAMIILCIIRNNGRLGNTASAPGRRRPPSHEEP